MNIEDFSEIKVDISEENDIIDCRIIIPPRSSYFPHRVDVTTKTVRELLARKGYKAGALIEGAGLCNKTPRGPLDGSWSFAKVVPPRPAPKKRATKPRTSKTTKTTKE